MVNYEVTVYCDDVSKNHVHCNKYLTVAVTDTDEIDEKIEEQGWQVTEDGIYCDDHTK